MQFVKDGPDVPDQLLQAHEEGKVVFFCGAGISHPASLPDFENLVEDMYVALGTTREPLEDEAFKRNQYDVTLDLLEHRFPGHSVAVRKSLYQVLNPNLKKKGAKDTHNALLELARDRDGSTRIVTTNFDWVFEKSAKAKKMKVNSYAAPHLPIPKASRWDGVVYLHGLLKEKGSDRELLKLILTSGDFGLAYLTERWASRFVSELFRNFTVCFVGYSINDPILRYMMDALAADKRLGEATPPVYAFGSTTPGNEEENSKWWEARKVIPILYKVPAGTNDHSLLHSTLHEWAATYRDGTLGKERIVTQYSIARPTASTQQDNFVGRLLWALSDASGLPAKRFAELNPAPSLDWLEPMLEKVYEHDDLVRFGVPPKSEVNDKLRFSLAFRPAPYTHAPWMGLIDYEQGVNLDNVMMQLLQWLLRHLGDPNLLLWCVSNSARLHERFRWLIQDRLNEIARMEKNDDQEGLDQLLATSPNAIPSYSLRTLWQIAISEQLNSNGVNRKFYTWKKRLRNGENSKLLRLGLRDILSPRVEMKKPIRWGEYDEPEEGKETIKDFVDWEIVLGEAHISYSIRDVQNLPEWKAVLSSMFDDFQELLFDALELMRDLGGVDEWFDRSHWDLSSISPHPQNRGFKDWVVLIELLRDSWLEIYSDNSEFADELATVWFDINYPTFKRLALFAARHDGICANGEWVDWLLEDDAWWLWLGDTKRETMRLLVMNGNKLPVRQAQRLERAILKGPPRKMYRDDVEEESWESIVEHSTWLHLKKLELSGRSLGAGAKERLEGLTRKNPVWRMAQNESDEFTHWMSGTGDPDFESKRVVEKAPRSRKKLVKWLQKPVSDDFMREDDWREVCDQRFYASFMALLDLSKTEKWPKERWRVALQVWSEEKNAARSWRFVSQIILDFPEDFLTDLVHGVSWWINSVSKKIDAGVDLLFALSERIIGIDSPGGVENDRPVSQAINHPVGFVTQALLQYWLKGDVKDNQGLQAQYKTIFSELCNIEISRYIHGRVILASHLIPLFRVDPGWTKKNLLPLFAWAENDQETAAVWEGFLWGPRIYKPLLVELHDALLATAEHYGEIGEHATQYVAFLTYVALDSLDVFTGEELNLAFSQLPQEGVEEMAHTLSQSLESSGEKKEFQWENRVKPFFQDVWPKNMDQMSENMANHVARLVIASGSKFPDALPLLENWLQPIEHADYLVHLLNDERHCKNHPEYALSFLDKIITNQAWMVEELGNCLSDLENSWPEVVQQPSFQRLKDFDRNRR